MKYPEFAKYSDKEKALDYAVWLNFINRVRHKTFSVIHIPENHFLVLPDNLIPRKNMVVSGKPKEYSQMSYETISQIKADKNPLSHWEELIGMFSVADGEILRFILKYRVPLKKIITLELAQRGFDENQKWCGFEEAKKIWLK